MLQLSIICNWFYQYRSFYYSTEETTKIQELILSLTYCYGLKETRYLSLKIGNLILKPKKKFQEYGIQNGTQITLYIQSNYA